MISSDGTGSIVTDMKNRAREDTHARHRITDHDMIDCWYEDGLFNFVRNSMPIPEDEARAVLDKERPRPTLMGALERLRIFSRPTDEIEQYVYAVIYNQREAYHGLTVRRMIFSVDAALDQVQSAGFQMTSMQYEKGRYHVALEPLGKAGIKVTAAAATLPMAIMAAVLPVRVSQIATPVPTA